MKRVLFLIFALISLLCLLTACGDDCEHSGGTATCTTPKICELCHRTYGEVDSSNHLEGEGWITDSENHKWGYTCCKLSDKEAEKHDFIMGICRDCGYGCEAHSGGEADCMSGAICSFCNMEYNEKDTTNHKGEIVWETDSKTHKGVCKNCAGVSVEETNHRWIEGVCADCEYKCLHSGGLANCASGAICEICSSEYGEKDLEVHSVTPTWNITPSGHVKHYNCGCDISYDDEVEAHNFAGGACVDCGYSCSHYGGTPTCINRALCENCGTPYGDKESSNHSGSPEVMEVSTNKHDLTYTCCGVSFSEKHIFADSASSCSLCGYRFDYNSTDETNGFVEEDTETETDTPLYGEVVQ